AMCYLPEFLDERDYDLCLFPPRREGLIEMLFALSRIPEVGTALVSPQGTVADAVKAGKPAQALEALYLAAYGRRPTAREAERLLKAQAAAGGGAAWWQDLYYAMLGSSEFALNH